MNKLINIDLFENEYYLFLRKRKGIKQKQVHLDLGIDPATLSKYESGKKDLTLENKRKYHKYILEK